VIAAPVVVPSDDLPFVVDPLRKGVLSRDDVAGAHVPIGKKRQQEKEVVKIGRGEHHHTDADQ